MFKNIAYTDAKYCTGVLIDCSDQQYCSKLPRIEEFLSRNDIVGLRFDSKSPPEFLYSSFMQQFETNQNEHASISIYSYIAGLYNNDAIKNKLQEIWLPIPKTNDNNEQEISQALHVIFSTAKHVIFRAGLSWADIPHPRQTTLKKSFYDNIIITAYSKSTKNAAFYLDQPMKSPRFRHHHISTIYAASIPHTTNAYKHQKSVTEKLIEILPSYKNASQQNKHGLSIIYDFIVKNPEPAVIGSDFDGTIFPEDNQTRGYEDILYTNFVPIHTTFIVRTVKEYLGKYPETFPKYKPNTVNGQNNEEWLRLYADNVLKAEFSQEDRYNNKDLTGGVPITGGINSTKDNHFDQLATNWWYKRLAIGYPSAYEAVFQKYSNILKQRAFWPVIDMLNFLKHHNTENRVAVITAAFPDFVKWFLTKLGLDLPVFGNRANQKDFRYTGTRDTYYFQSHPEYYKRSPTENAVDKAGKAEILKYYLQTYNLKPKIFFGNSDGDYEACLFTLEHKGIAVLINPRGQKINSLRCNCCYGNRVVVLNFESSVKPNADVFADSNTCNQNLDLYETKEPS